jgi:Arc/MetJ-type ribon-helix-helix transcriptional regulator
MKTRVSATIDEKTLGAIETILKKGKYRNKSHVIEEAIKLLEKKT